MPYKYRILQIKGDRKENMNIKELIQKHKPIIILVTIIIILITLNLYMLWLLNKTEEEEEPIIETEEKEEIPKLLKVDIKGEIQHPGLYEVSENSRVMDIINKAGGLTKNADTSVINLSKKIKDEMVILVYSKKEVQKLKENNEKIINCPKVNDACVTNELEEPLIESNKTDTTKNTNSKISINKATIEQLQSLTGIGESKAKAIIEYRLKEGEFKTIEDIKKVNGIGDALFEKIKDNITI